MRLTEYGARATIGYITDAFERSTKSDNAFARAIENTDWENKFEADGELYFVSGPLTLTTPSLDPFEVTREWPAEFMLVNHGCWTIDVFGRAHDIDGTTW